MAGNFLTPLRAYSSAKVTLHLGGLEVFGFADDSKIVISKADDIIIPYEGVDGEISLAINAKKMGTMTISLQNTSKFNEILEVWVTQSTTTGFASFPVLMNDPAGSTLLSAFGWIQTMPDYTVGTEVGTRDWVIGLQDARTSPSTATSPLNALQANLGI